MKSFTLTMFVSAVLAAGAASAGEGKWNADAEFKKMDADGNGQVTASEHSTRAKAMFTKMDADKDGKVTAAEMDASHMAMKDKAMKGESHAAKDDSTHSQAHDGGKHGHEMSSAQMIAKIDGNQDGMLTAAEHESGSKRMFTKMDANGDGSLSKEECREGHKKMMTASDTE